MRLGKILGVGTERTCYEDLDDPNVCYKVSTPSKFKQTLREAKYFEYLEKKKIKPTFMPRFFGLLKVEGGGMQSGKRDFPAMRLVRF